MQLFGVGSSLAVVDDQDMELGGSVVVPAEAEGGGEEEEGEGGGGRTVTVVAGRKRSAAELNSEANIPCIYIFPANLELGTPV